MNAENIFASRNDDDVVFDNRNKSYGAYFIRKSYFSNLSKSSATSLLCVGIALAAIQLAVMIKPGIIPTVIKATFTHTPLTNIKVIQEEQPKLQPRLKKTDGFPLRVVRQEVVDKPFVDNQPASISNSEVTGEPMPASPGTGTVETPIPTTTPLVESPKVLDHAEVMPEFQGGLNALYKFLRKTLRYPKAAQRIGQEGTVFVRFIIDVNGAVTNVEVITSVSGALDTEATRVTGLMPNWKPGMQHGMPVNVRMVLPITFKLTQE